jgi:hypothetical protein
MITRSALHPRNRVLGWAYTVGVLKGVLILQRKFAVVGASEPIVITNSGVCGNTPLRQYCTGARPQSDALVGILGSAGQEQQS